MRSFHGRAATALLVVAVWAGAASVSRAQVFIGWREYDRMLQPGAVVPHDGEPFSHRYGFYDGPSFYFGMDSNHFQYMDYLDRLDRAERFGYRLPTPPAFLTTPRCRPCER
jgi:hypothetical protein